MADINESLDLNTGNIEEINNTSNVNTTNTTEIDYNQSSEVNQTETQTNQQATPPTGEDGADNIVEGMSVVIDGVDCTVNADGSAVDVNGNVVKTREELTALIAANTEQEPSILDSLQERFGSDFVDADGNTVEFENTPEGINSYIDAVVSSSVREAQTSIIDNLFGTYPALEQAYNYIKLNGTLDGFNEIPDRNNIEIQKDNEEQQVAVIKEEWELQGKKGDVKGYIDYLKAAGILYDTAVESNKTVAEIYDAQRSAQEQEIAKREAAEQERINSYWNSVGDIITRGEIAGYKIPDTIQRSINGKLIASTKEDFMKYLSVPVDAEGNTGYMLDEAKVDEEARIQDDLLRAYLKFTGGNYSSLVNMAVNKEKVLNLRTQAQQVNTRKTLVLNSKGNNSKSVDNNDILL